MFCLKKYNNFSKSVNKIGIKRYKSSTLANAYQPKSIECQPLVYKKTEECLKKAKNGVFSMIFPPPNVTGNLHLGHTLTATIQDVIARRQLEKGLETIWIPGMDHAGIATQVVVEKNLMKERNISRHDLGRQKFSDEIAKWKDHRAKDIRRNLQSLGLSFNWEEEYYTMDEIRCKAVAEAFIRLHDMGLIYRDSALVNWSCVLESAISDIEIENVEINEVTKISVPGYEKPITFGEITDVSYRIFSEGSECEEIVVSTTRPETLLGDAAVAVHPEDPRYVKYHSRNVELWHPFRETPIPLVFDDSVDMNFGTGAVKITPSHDKKDFHLARRHNLPSIDVIDEGGRIHDGYGSFSQLPRFEAREKIKESLARLGLLKETRSHQMILPRCSRSGDIVEYLNKPQWFLKCQEAATEAVEAVRSGTMKIYPEEFKSEWYRWLENCHDWCISRQIWWGHRIPAYKCTSGTSTKWISATTLAEALEKARRVFPDGKVDSIERDRDVLDTWFSSGLLPFSVFGWPENTPSLQKAFPLNLMETGHDIVFFWVARMTMLSLLLTKQLPFREVLLHGIICDSKGRKMSKSLGNIILPEQVIHGASLRELVQQTEYFHRSGVISEAEMTQSTDEILKIHPNGIPECGIDALRFTLCSANIKNHFINFDMVECHANKLFFNKIWQATRFTIKAFETLETSCENLEKSSGNLTEMDQWILQKLTTTRDLVTKSIDQYNFHLATNALKTFFYSHFCNVYLETTKAHINAKSHSAHGHLLTLRTCLAEGLKLMEYFTPFLSQELLQHLPSASEMRNLDDIKVEDHVEEIINICSTIRAIKSQNNIVKKHNPYLIMWADPFFISHLKNHSDNIRTLTMIKNLDIFDDREEFNGVKCTLKSTANHFCVFGIHIPEDTTDRLSNTNKDKLIKLTANLRKLEEIVKNEGYQKSAAESKKQKHQEKIKHLQAEIDAIREFV
ncbi:Valyl-tRNA synthetase [Sergentomyia squamirostris]